MWCLCQSWDPLIMRAGEEEEEEEGTDWVAATASVVLRWWPSQHAPCQHTMGGNCETVRRWWFDLLRRRWGAGGHTNLLRWPHNSSSWQFCVIINCLLSSNQCDISNWHYCFLPFVLLLLRDSPESVLYAVVGGLEVETFISFMF